MASLHRCRVCHDQSATVTRHTPPTTTTRDSTPPQDEQEHRTLTCVAVREGRQQTTERR